MANFDVTGSQVLNGCTAPPTLDFSAADFEWLEHHHRFVLLTGAAPLPHRLATAPATSSVLRCHRRLPEMKIAAGTNVSEPTTVSVEHDFLTPWPEPLSRNSFFERGALS